MNQLNNKRYKLKNITNLCSNNGLKNPEFRLTEIKSSMRFWWRALNFYCDCAKMKKDEEKIFGNSNTHKSPIIFKIESNELKLAAGGHEVKKNNKINCFKSGGIVEIKLGLYKRKIGHTKYIGKNLEFYNSLLKVSLIFGGVGNRARRGCGVFNIEENDEFNFLNRVEQYMKNLNITQYYDFFNQGKYFKICRKEKYKNKSLKYPYIEEVFVSKNPIKEDEFYLRIKKAIDDTKNEKLEYKGYNCKKLASPIYVTCYGDINNLYPIIIKLNNTSLDRRNLHKTYDDYYKKFKEVILCHKK